MKKDEIKSEFDEVKCRLDEYNSQLRDHMSRTALLETAVSAQKDYFEFRHNEIDARALRIWTSLDTRIKEQETALHGLPTKLLQYVSIIGGVVGLLKLLF